VQLFDPDSAQEVALASDIDLVSGPTLAASDDDVVAMQWDGGMLKPKVAIDFVRAGRRVVLTSPFDRVYEATIDHGIVYLLGADSDGTTWQAKTAAISDAGAGVPQVLNTDPLLIGVSWIVKDANRAALVTRRNTLHPKFTVSQRCAPTVP
jgi:hypothetical protein